MLSCYESEAFPYESEERVANTRVHQAGTGQCDAEPVRAWGTTMGCKDLPAAWRKDLRGANLLG
eukprot:4014890-Amphidinium_carterae.1